MRFWSLLAFLAMATSAFSQKHTFYVGTYTGTGSKGIYVYELDEATGALTWLGNTDSGTVANPSYLALSPNGKNLYAVNETGGQQTPTLSAFEISGNNLRFLNKVPTGGDHPCYVAVHKSGKWAVAGNYSGGSFSAMPIGENGSLQPYSQLVQHQGTGPDKERQEKAHVHMTQFTPEGNRLLVPDLGTDRVHIYQFNPESNNPLHTASQPFVKIAPGGGPRHIRFHPAGKFAYLMEELSGMVTAFSYKNGTLKQIQRISSHPAGYKGAIGSADIQVSPDGKFLYASNRGDANNIAVFSIAANGKLTWVEAVSAGGKSPRNISITPGGKFLLAANQDSDNVVVFRRDATSGKLTPAGVEVTIPKPVCIIFAQQ